MIQNGANMAPKSARRRGQAGREPTEALLHRLDLGLGGVGHGSERGGGEHFLRLLLLLGLGGAVLRLGLDVHPIERRGHVAQQVLQSK